MARAPSESYSASIEVTSPVISGSGLSAVSDVVEILTFLPISRPALPRMSRSGSRNTSVNMSGMLSRSTTSVLSSWPSTSAASSVPSISTIRWMEAVVAGIAISQEPRAASARLGIRRVVPAATRCGSSIPLSSAIARQYAALPSSA